MKKTRKTKTFAQLTSPDGSFVGVCGREIYEHLGSKGRFQDWLKINVRKPLVQGKDYAIFKGEKNDNRPGSPGNIYLIAPAAADRLLGKEQRRPAPAPVMPDVQPEIVPPTEEELMELQAQAEKMLPILETMFGDDDTLSVDARQLHEALGSEKNFPTWFKQQLERSPWEENNDYIEVLPLKGKNSQNPSSGRPRTDYALTLDMAKQIAMMSQCKMGYAIRKYFIQAEKMMRKTQNQKQLMWNPALYSDAYPKDGRLVRERQLKEFLIEIETMAQLVCPENPEAAEKFINWSVCINLDVIELRDTRCHLVHAVREVLKACHQVFSQRGFEPEWADEGGLLITWNPTSCSYAATHPCFEPVTMFLTASELYRTETQLRPDFQLEDILCAINTLEGKDVSLNCARDEALIRFDDHQTMLDLFTAFYAAGRKKEDALHGRNRKTIDKAHALYERRKNDLFHRRLAEARQAEKTQSAHQIPGKQTSSNIAKRDERCVKKQRPRIYSWRDIK